MRLTVRAMHESETPLIRSTWTGSIDPHVHHYTDEKGRKRSRVVNGRVREVAGNRTPWMRFGDGDLLVTWAWHDMHRAWVRSLWDGLTVLVAAHPANDEAVGWCALTPPGDEPLVVHYVFTIDLQGARRRGVAKQLLHEAMAFGDGRRIRYSHMTPIGQHMVESLDARVATIRDGASMH